MRLFSYNCKNENDSLYYFQAPSELAIVYYLSRKERGNRVTLRKISLMLQTIALLISLSFKNKVYNL